MISIVEIYQPFAIGFLPQLAHNLLPDPATLVLEQPTITRLIGCLNVMGHIFPAATRRQDLQNAIEDFTLVNPGAACGRWFGQQAFDMFPLGVGQIGTIGFAQGC